MHQGGAGEVADGDESTADVLGSGVSASDALMIQDTLKEESIADVRGSDVGVSDALVIEDTLKEESNVHGADVSVSDVRDAACRLVQRMKGAKRRVILAQVLRLWTG